MEGSLSVSSDVLLAIFCFETRHFYGAAWVVRKEKIRCRSNYQNRQSTYQVTFAFFEEWFFTWIFNVFFAWQIVKNVTLNGRWKLTQSGKTKMVAPALKCESNWTEKYIFVNHLSRPFIWESLRNFIFSHPSDDSWKLERTALNNALVRPNCSLMILNSAQDNISASV